MKIVLRVQTDNFKYLKITPVSYQWNRIHTFLHQKSFLFYGMNFSPPLKLYWRVQSLEKITPGYQWNRIHGHFPVLLFYFLIAKK